MLVKSWDFIWCTLEVAVYEGYKDGEGYSERRAQFEGILFRTKAWSERMLKDFMFCNRLHAL